MDSFSARLARLGVILPTPRPAIANYVPWVVSGGYLYISGQVSATVAGEAVVGVVGRELSLECGIKAARLCGVNLLAQMADALDDDVERVAKVVKLTGFIQAEETLLDLAQVMDGCSIALIEVLGQVGQHARSCVGVYCLPRNHAVEVEAIVQLR